MAKSLWFRDDSEDILMIDENIIRARAGFFLFLPIFMAFTIFDFNSMFTTQWIVDNATANLDFMDADDQGRQVYMVEAVKRTYAYTLQTLVLTIALFEMFLGMNKKTCKLSPTIFLASYLMRNKKPVYVPYFPKRFAWGIGVFLMSLCILFFNPITLPFVGLIILPLEFALSLLTICSVFIWLEVSFGYCVGCKFHALLVKIGLLKDECYECNNIQ
jgi:hypothetical protein